MRRAFSALRQCSPAELGLEVLSIVGGAAFLVAALAPLLG